MRPILIMSSERSGSNLLRRMLAAHPDVAAPPPPHLWDVLVPLLPRYGPLHEGDAWRTLLADALALTQVQGSHTQWRHELQLDEVAARVRQRSLSGLLGALYEAYAAREGAKRWACKENNLFHHAFRILAAFPQASVVYLARDGRDVACSIRKVPTHDQHAYFIAREWRDEQRRCISVHLELLDSGRSTLLRYEELIREPERELRRLCAALELEFDGRMLDFHAEQETRDEARKTLYWKNLERPVQAANSGKFLAELPPRELALFELVAGEELELLGYPLAGARRKARLGGVEKALIRLGNGWHKRRKRKEYYREAGRRERDEAMARVRSLRQSARLQPLAERLAPAP